MLTLLSVMTTAQAACPPATPRDAMRIAETFLELAESGDAAPWNDRISEPLQFDSIIDGVEDAAGRLERVALTSTGEGARDAEPGFMDVAFDGTDVVFYLQPERAVVIDADRHVRLRRPRAGMHYARICADLHDAYTGARLLGIDARIASVAPGTKPVPAAIPAPTSATRDLKPTVRLGLSGQYSFALGPSEEPVVASAMGVAGYFDLELNPVLATRLDLRYNRAEGSPTEYRGASSTLTTDGLRFSLEARAQLQGTQLGVQGSLGPAFGVYTVCGTVGAYAVGCGEVGTELMLGAHASLHGTWTASAGGLGVFVGPDVEVYRRHSDPADPVLDVGVRLGVIFGRAKAGSRAR